MSDPTTLTLPADAPDLLALRSNAERHGIAFPLRVYEASEGYDNGTPAHVIEDARASIVAYGRAGAIAANCYLVAAANAAPELVAERDALRADLDTAAADLTRFRMQYLTVADAIAPSSNGAHELADKVWSFRKRAEALEADRAELDRQLFAALAEGNEAAAALDTALARVAELEAQLAKRNAKNEHNRPRIDAMLKIIDDTADADCAFGDGCLLGPVCLPCRARHLLPALETP